MAIGTPVLLDSGGTDTDARDYNTVNTITPTLGRTILVALGALDLGSALSGALVLTGWGLNWTIVSAVGGNATEPDLFVWRASGPAVSAGVLSFAGVVTAGQTADGIIWMAVEIPNTDLATKDGVIQFVDTGTVPADTITTNLGAFRDPESITADFALAYDNAGGALSLTVGSGFTMLSQLSQAAGGDTLTLGFQYKMSNNTAVDVSVSAANDRLEHLPMEIGHWRPRPSGLITPHAGQRKSRR